MYMDYVIRKDVKVKNLSNFLLSVTPDKLSMLLASLLTEAEVDDLLMRIKIIKKYMGGKISQRQLAKNLNISVTTVNRRVSECRHNKEIFSVLLSLGYEDEKK